MRLVALHLWSDNVGIVWLSCSPTTCHLLDLAWVRDCIGDAKWALPCQFPPTWEHPLTPLSLLFFGEINLSLQKCCETQQGQEEFINCKELHLFLQTGEIHSRCQLSRLVAAKWGASETQHMMGVVWMNEWTNERVPKPQVSKRNSNKLTQGKLHSLQAKCTLVNEKERGLLLEFHLSVAAEPFQDLVPWYLSQRIWGNQTPSPPYLHFFESEVSLHSAC